MRFLFALCFVLVVIGASVLLYIDNVMHLLKSEAQKGAHIETIDKEERISILYELKTILLLEPIWGFDFPGRRIGFIEGGCSNTNCLLTRNQTEMDEDQFDAVIFHAPTLRKEWLLRDRKPHQMFIFYSNEAPGMHGMPTDLTSLDGFYNRTMSYKSGSDFLYPYGAIQVLPTAPKTKAERLRMIKAMRQSEYNLATGKSKLVVWMASNCDTPSNRWDYVKALQKYIDVDIISKNGKCGGTDACPFSESYKDHQDGCRDMIESTYKFHLSFENSICQDYVTEKFYFAIGRNIVPVVLGGANYSALAPPHSYIDALDYKPRELAKYLLKLDQDDALYAEYFWWKPHYRVFNPLKMGWSIFCDICEALHRPPLEHKVITGLQDWYVSGSQCIDRPTYDPN